MLELPLRSFVSLEPAWVIADDRVAGDLYNPVQTRGGMAAGRKGGGEYNLYLWWKRALDHTVWCVSAWITWKEPSCSLGCLRSCGCQKSFFPGSSTHCAGAPTPPVGLSWKASEVEKKFYLWKTWSTHLCISKRVNNVQANSLNEIHETLKRNSELRQTTIGQVSSVGFYGRVLQLLKKILYIYMLSF